MKVTKQINVSSHVTDNGEAVESPSVHSRVISYIPYGEIFMEQQSGGWQSPYLFNSKELDSESGLNYYGARYLDPTHAMWLSVDPLWEKYVGMSPYGYCAGNPVGLVDVDGRDYLQNENGEMQYFPFDLKQHGAIEGENFNITINDKVYSGIYRGKTYDDGNYYWGLFGIGYKSGSREAKITEKFDYAVISYVNYIVGTNNNIGKSDKYGIPLETPSYLFNLNVDIQIQNKSCLTEENVFSICYANGYGTFTVFSDSKNMRGKELSMPNEYSSRRGTTTNVEGYYLTFINENGPQGVGMDIINIKFSKENGENFVKHLNRLYPEIETSRIDRKKRIGY